MAAEPETEPVALAGDLPPHPGPWRDCPRRAQGCGHHVRTTTHPGTDRPPTVEGSCDEGVKMAKSGGACRGAAASWRKGARDLDLFRPKLDIESLQPREPEPAGERQTRSDWE